MMLALGTLQRVLLVMAMLSVVGMRTVSAQPSAERKSTESAVSEAPGDGESLREKQKRKKAAVGLFALFGIALAGIAMLAFVIIWGRRLRRISHQPYPSVRQADELWYLKPDKQSPTTDDDRTDVP